MKKIYFYLFIVCTLTSCAWNTVSSEKKVVAVTIEPLRYFVEQIAGDKFDIVSLVPKSGNPETYEPTSKQLVELSESAAFLNLGQIGFERVWSERLASNSSKIRSYNLSKGIELIYNINQHHHHSDDEQPKAGADPHIWCSIKNVRIIAENILSAMVELDAEQADFYQANYHKFLERIDKLEDEMSLFMNKSDRSFVIYHPALAYFARDYGLVQIGLEEEGKDITAQHMKEVISECGRYNTKLFFLQPEIDRRKAEALANELKLSVVEVNLLTYNWEEMMLQVGKALAHVSVK